MVIQQIRESYLASVSSKRTRSPSSARSSRGKENDPTMTESSRNKQTSDKPTGFRNSSKVSQKLDMLGTETDFDDVIFHTPSPIRYDAPFSPPSKMRNNLRRVILYDNMKENRILQHELRKLDTEHNRETASMAMDMALVRESSADIARVQDFSPKLRHRNVAPWTLVARTQRVGSADSVAAMNSNLPPITADGNSSLTYSHQQRQNITNSSDVIRQKTPKMTSQSTPSGLSLPQIYTENRVKPNSADRAKMNPLSLPDVFPNQSKMTTRKFIAEMKMPKGTSESQSDALSLQRCLNDGRFKRLHESLLSMSTTRDVEDRRNDSAEQTSTTKQSDENHNADVDGDDDNEKSPLSCHLNAAITERTD